MRCSRRGVNAVCGAACRCARRGRGLARASHQLVSCGDVTRLLLLPQHFRRRSTRSTVADRSLERAAQQSGTEAARCHLAVGWAASAVEVMLHTGTRVSYLSSLRLPAVPHAGGSSAALASQTRPSSGAGTNRPLSALQKRHAYPRIIPSRAACRAQAHTPLAPAIQQHLDLIVQPGCA